MAWTTPRTWTTTELVTAAMMNTHVRDNISYLGGTNGAFVNDTATGFTNTSYADMDALAVDPLASPVIVSCLTGTTALVFMSARMLQATAGDMRISYRVSGATTLAASDTWSMVANSAAGNAHRTMVHAADGLTAGTNVFEMQAKVSANSGTIVNPTLTVIPLST